MFHSVKKEEEKEQFNWVKRKKKKTIHSFADSVLFGLFAFFLTDSKSIYLLKLKHFQTFGSSFVLQK